MSQTAVYFLLNNHSVFRDSFDFYSKIILRNLRAFLRRLDSHSAIAWIVVIVFLLQSCLISAPVSKPAVHQPTGAATAPTLLPSVGAPLGQEPDPQAGPVFQNIRLSATNVPRYEKLEISFDLDTTATMPQFPYDAAPPSGVQPGVGVSVEAQFSADGWRTVYRQPAFLYQEFQDEIRGGKEWFYPSDVKYWKVRFSPPRMGPWQVKLVAQDSGGRSETSPQNFQVLSSPNKGFIRVSKRDTRYFEYENGDYFPALGYNMNYSAISWTNPRLDNEENFRIMSENGIQLVRMWLSQWSIYGAAWNPWNSIDPALHSQYIPHSSLTFQNPYPGQNGQQASETSLRLDAAGNACMFLGFMKPAPAVKSNTQYRVRVRYRTDGLQGPRRPGNFGLVVKTGGWLQGNGQDCYDSGTGQALTAPTGGAATDWRILEGTLNTGNNSFLPNFYLALENTLSGTVLIDYVWLEENMGGGRYGLNILPKPWMSHHLYFDQRNSYAFDKVVELAEEYGIYLRPVMLEKNDWIMNRMDHEGRPILYDPSCDDSTPANDPTLCPGNRWFYGSGREVTKNRWLQQAWWRYAQARWGYSTSIHSWELLNEGDPADTNHFILADEFGKYMHQFSPNDHLVSTSFWHSFPRDAFWANAAYPNVDFADIHRYIEDNSVAFRDTAQLTINLSLQLGAKQAGGAGKPVIRGETGLLIGTSETANTLVDRDVDGVWLHNYVWAGINPGGLIEQYWWVEQHIYRYTAAGRLVFDHRPEYGTYYQFIQDIPLNNGAYQDAAPSVSDSRLRAVGQKDVERGRAHLWIQNVEHSWYNVIHAIPVHPVSGTIQLSGFQPGLQYQVEWWDTYNLANPVLRRELTTATAAGVIPLHINALSADTAVKIAPFAPIDEFRIFVPTVVAP